MAGDLNRATIIGRLGGDPEVRTLSNGSRVVMFSIATGESWRDKNTGERRENTQWHRVVIWNEGIGKVAEQYLKKGSKCLIEGRMETREFDDQQQIKRKITEVVVRNFDGKLLLLGEKDGDSGDAARGSSSGSSASRSGGAGNGGGKGRPQQDFDDEIPF